MKITAFMLFSMLALAGCDDSEPEQQCPGDNTAPPDPALAAGIEIDGCTVYEGELYCELGSVHVVAIGSSGTLESWSYPICEPSPGQVPYDEIQPYYTQGGAPVPACAPE